MSSSWPHLSASTCCPRGAQFPLAMPTSTLYSLQVSQISDLANKQTHGHQTPVLTPSYPCWARLIKRLLWLSTHCNPAPLPLKCHHENQICSLVSRSLKMSAVLFILPVDSCLTSRSCTNAEWYTVLLHWDSMTSSTWKDIIGRYLLVCIYLSTIIKIEFKLVLVVKNS